MKHALRTTIVSGGTGALGRAVVECFLAAGDRVVVSWQAREQRDALAHTHADALNAGRLLLIEADIADESGAARTAEVAGPAQVLINGAGGFEGGQPLQQSELASWDRMFRTNLRTAVALTRAVLPNMLKQQSGVILNVAAQAAWTTPAGLSAYSASKSALIALTHTLQKEVETHGIRVNAVAPGTIDTVANRRAMPKANPSRWTPPTAIAHTLFWLASDDASAVRGAVIPV